MVSKDLFYLDYEGLIFPIKQLFSLQAFSNFKLTSNQRDAFLIDVSLCFRVFRIHTDKKLDINPN